MNILYILIILVPILRIPPNTNDQAHLDSFCLNQDSQDEKNFQDYFWEAFMYPEHPDNPVNPGSKTEDRHQKPKGKFLQRNQIMEII
jgi:hypothetical protein